MPSGGFRDFSFLPLGVPPVPPVPPPSGPFAGFLGFLDFTGLPAGQAVAITPPPPAAGVLGFVDFAMYPVGQIIAPVAPPPPAGALGFIDFSMIPSAQGPPAPPPQPAVIGFSGFLDFVGYPVAQGTGAVILRAKGHGFRGAGKYTDAVLRQIQERRRRIREQRRIHKFPPPLIRDLITQRVVMNQWEKERVHKKQIAEAAMYSVLLAEL